MHVKKALSAYFLPEHLRTKAALCRHVHTTWPKYRAEGLGTMLLVFFRREKTRRIGRKIVLFPVTLTAATSPNLEVSAVGAGVALFTCVVVFGGPSGNFNPAMSMAEYVAGNICGFDLLIYTLSQLIGSVVGSLMTRVRLWR